MDWIPEDGHPGDPGDDLLEQLELFPHYLETKRGESCHVPTRPRKAGDEPRDDSRTAAGAAVKKPRRVIPPRPAQPGSVLLSRGRRGW